MDHGDLTESVVLLVAVELNLDPENVSNLNSSSSEISWDVTEPAQSSDHVTHIAAQVCIN